MATADMPNANSSSRRSGQIVSGPPRRGLARNWWRILLLWLVVSSLLAYTVYRLVEPTYQAYSLLRIHHFQGVCNALRRWNLCQNLMSEGMFPDMLL